jgi:hypothetical protein
MRRNLLEEKKHISVFLNRGVHEMNLGQALGTCLQDNGLRPMYV